ncbi:hypothetical protein S83_042672 [Arachis hypogaea]
MCVCDLEEGEKGIKGTSRKVALVFVQLVGVDCEGFQERARSLTILSSSKFPHLHSFLLIYFVFVCCLQCITYYIEKIHSYLILSLQLLIRHFLFVAFFCTLYH